MEYIIGAVVSLVIIIGFIFFYKAYVNKRLEGKYKRIRLPNPIVFSIVICFLFAAFAVSFSLLKPSETQSGTDTPQCFVKYMRLNGDNVWYTVETVQLEYNAHPALLDVKSERYYTLEGYFKDDEFNEEVDFETDYASGAYYGEIADKIEKGEKFTDSYTFYIYLKFTPVQFNITYHLNGGVNNPENPSTFNVTQKNFLKPATKNGYYFIGWYTDPYGYYKYVAESYYTYDLEVYALFADEVTASANLSYSYSTVNILNTTAEEIFIPAIYDGIFIRELNNIAENYTVKRLYLPSSLFKINYSAWNEVGLYKLKALEEIIISDGNEYYSSANGLLFNKSGTELLFVPLAKTEATLPDATRTIKQDAFAWSSATTVIFNNGLEKIESSAFYFAGITAVHLPKTVKYIGEQAFSACFDITSFTFEAGALIEALPDRMFTQAYSLTEFTVPSKVKTLSALTFNYGAGLTAIYVEEGSEFYKSHDGVLYTKDGKTLVCIPLYFRGGDYRLPEGTEIIANYAAYYGNSYIKLFAPSSLREIGISAFERSYISEIVFDDVNSLKIIGARAFNISNIKSLAYSNDIEYIGVSAFYGAKSMSDMFIPKCLNNLNPWYFSQGDQINESIWSYFTKITVGEGNTTFATDENGFLYNVVDKALMLGLFSSTLLYDEVFVMDGTLSIADSFSNVGGIEKLYLPASLQTINPATLCGIMIGYIEVSSENRYLCSVEGVLFSKDMKKLWFYPATKQETEFTLPDATEEIVNYALFRAWRLEILYINANLKKLNSNGWNEYNLYECSSMKAFVVSPMNTSFQSVEGVLYTRDGTRLICYPANKESESYSVLGGTQIISVFAFRWVPNLNKVYVPESVHTMEVFAFYGIYHDIDIYLMRNVERDGGYLEVDEQFIDSSFASGLPKIIVPKKYEEYYRSSAFFSRVIEYFVFI